jgi:hypothetical protein
MITLNRDLLNVAANLPTSDYFSERSEFGTRLDDQDGFKFLGAGCERTVWLGPDGYVYKIDKYDGNANWNEKRHSERLRAKADLPTWVYIPEVAYDEETKVEVTEYIVGSTPWDCYYDDCKCETDYCLWSLCSEAFDYCGSVDGHPGNCRVIVGNTESECIVVLIDFTR